MMNNYKILIIDDDKLVTWSLSRDFKSEGCDPIIAMTGENGLSIFRSYTPDLILLDLKLPDIDGLELINTLKKEAPDVIIVMMTAYATVQTAVEAVKRGATDFIKKPFTFDELKIILEKALKNHQLNREVSELRQQLKYKHGISTLLGKSYCMQKVFEMIRKVAQSNATTILLTGESGTGKDLVAKAIHYESKRSQYPFMAINCGSLPDSLLESELFGHEKGAFTDAKDIKKGLFELANNGTVLLDEIGDASIPFQVKLLRFLEEKTFKRIGGTKDIAVNIRITAATNKNLEQLVKAGKFREDLYYRLNVIPISISPLRERPEDIPLLVHYYIDHFNKELNKHVASISPEAMEILMNHYWAGNVRELRNVLERVMILESQEVIMPEDLPIELIQKQEKGLILEDFHFPIRGTSLEKVEKALIEKALEQTNGNQSHAAKLLQISRHALRYKMQKHQIMN